MRSKYKSNFVLFIFIISGIVIGGFLGTLAQNTSYFSWLNFYYSFGLDNPLYLNLVALELVFGFNLNISIASIIGVLLSIMLYKKIS